MLQKILIGLLIGLAVFLGAVIVKDYFDQKAMAELRTQLNSKLMEANLQLGRAQTQIVDLDHEVLHLREDIQHEIKVRQSQVTRYAELEARYRVLASNLEALRIEVNTGEPIVVPGLALEPQMLYQTLDGTALLPVETLKGEFQDNRLKLQGVVSTRPIRFSFGYELNLRLGMRMVEAHTPSGAINHYAELYEIDEDGKELGQLELEKFEVKVQDPTIVQWFWWAPYIDLGAVAGASFVPPDFTAGGSVGFSPFGLGTATDRLQWRFLRVSFDLLGVRPGVGITPALWNIGQVVPFVRNLWIGPHLNHSFTHVDDWKLGIFLGASL